MRKLSIPFLSLFILLTGCLFAPTPSRPFVREVHVDVARMRESEGPLLKLSVSEGPHPTGQDLVVLVELGLPTRQLKTATVDVMLHRADSAIAPMLGASAGSGRTKPVRRARLSHLRAGKLELVLSMAGLHAGRYILAATLTPSGEDAVEKTVSFELSP